MSDISEEILAVWEVTDSSQAESRFREMLSDYEASHRRRPANEYASFNPSTTDRGQVLTQLARALGFQGRFEEASILLSEAEAVSEQTQISPIGKTDDLVILKVRIQLERGRIYDSKGEREHSVQYFRKALEEASSGSSNVGKSTSDESPKLSILNSPTLQYLTVDALHMLAIVSARKEERAAYAQSGLAIAGSVDAEANTKRWLGPLLNNFAWDALENGEFGTAIERFQQAVIVRKAALDELAGASPPTKTDSAISKMREKRITAWKISRWSVAHAQMLAGEIDTALGTFQGILDDDLDGPSIREDLALIYAKRGDVKALDHAQKALKFGVQGKKAEALQEVIDKFST